MISEVLNRKLHIDNGCFTVCTGFNKLFYSYGFKEIMIFIDWWSPHGHICFNKSFFNALGLKKQMLYVFDEELTLENQEVVCFNIKSRFLRFLKVLNICISNRNKKVIFLTYDSIFIPILNILSSNIFLMEHNTVPENKNKHYFFQTIFLENRRGYVSPLSKKSF